MPSLHSYRMCSKQNMTVDQTAAFLGTKPNVVLSMAKRFDLHFVGIDPVPLAWRGLTPREPVAADPVMCKVFRMDAAGHPPDVIATVTGLRRGDVVKALEGIE
jgi:hypothetical protein